MCAKRVLIGILGLILLLQIVSAAFTIDLNASSIKKTYSVGEELSGTIVIVFDNESLDSEISSNLGGDKVTLEKWLTQSGKRQKIDYNCTFDNCSARYQSIGNISELNLYIQQPKIFGFRASGSGVNVSSLSFGVKSNLQNSCAKPYSIDALNSGKYVLENYRFTSNFCQNSRQGCFDYTLPASGYQVANLTTNPYCERIRLDAAPAYLFGANISKPLNARDEQITLQLYDSSFTIYYGNCSVSGLQNTSSCIIPYPITKEDEYSVCVLTNQTNSAYQIRTEFTGSICGTANFGQSVTRDFDIYARGLEYSSEEAYFNEDSFAQLNGEEEFNSAINEYLKTEYGRNCLTQDCFIPFKIVGNTQQLSFSNTSFVYFSEGVPISENAIYQIAKKPSTIKSGRLTLSLESADLKILQKNNILQVNIGNITLFRTNVSVTNMPISIEPSFALIGVPITFQIKSNESIATATWKFSDEATIRQGLTAARTFSQAGTFNVEVTATSIAGKVYTKSQQILVGEPRASAYELVKLSEQSIGAIAQDMKALPAWILPGVQSKINVVALNNSLATISEKLRYAENSSQFIEIIEEVQALNIPNDLAASRIGEFPIIYSYANINLDYLKSIYQVDGETEHFKTAILEWTRDNYDGQIETTTYSVSDPQGKQEALLTKIKITASPKTPSLTNTYLIIDYPLEALHFSSGYSQKEIQSGTYLPLGDSNNIEFYVEGDVPVESFGIYILPTLNDLETGGYSYELATSSGEKQKSVIYVSLGILILILVIAAGTLQYWYRHNYEKYLFKGEESLFNVMTFIYNAKRKGLKEGDIRKNLLSSGWTREQINYALGRFEGKIFGLFGIPIYSARQEEKMKSSIEQRQRQNTGRKVY